MSASKQATIVMSDLELAIARLPRSQREAFLMATRDQLSYAAIAQRLHISPREVVRLIARALVSLDRALQQR